MKAYVRRCSHTAAVTRLSAITLLVLSPMPSRCGELPAAGDYLGEIRRDADGKLIAVPARNTTTALPDRALGTGRLLQIGPDKTFRTIAAAARQARDGDTVEIDAGEYSGDVAVWQQDQLTIRGVGGRVNLNAAGASAEGKAIWVVRGGRITIENIEFTGARVRDRNGAGIRFEKGSLTVRNCRFLDNENGILTGGGDGELLIEDSEFGHNGAGDGQSHNLYVGALRRLTVTGSYFHHANVGHLLKTRALENHILYNRLTDESGGRASYELEFPNGGLAYVIGNIIEQSATTENRTLISFGAEGYPLANNQLYLINNTLTDKRAEGGTFLAVRPGFTTLKAYNNLLLGRRPLNAGFDGEFVNNPNVTTSAFVLAERHDYRLARNTTLDRTYVPPGTANLVNLAPDHEYVHVARTRKIPGAPTRPGAKQTTEPDISVAD